MKEFFKHIKFAWNYAKDQKIKIILYIITNIINIFISIFVPIISANIIVEITNSQFKQVIMLAIVLFCSEMLRNIVNYLSSYFSQKVYRETFTKIQNNLGKQMLRLENRCIDRTSSGVFIQRLTNDTSRIADIFNVLNFNLGEIITNIGIFSAVFIINKIAFIYLVISVLTLYVIERQRVGQLNDKDKVFRKKNEQVSGFVGELVRGVRDIKMLNAETSFLSELDSKVTDLNQQRYLMGQVNRKYTLLRGTIMDLSDLGMIILLVILIASSNLLVAEALVIHNYMNRVRSIVNCTSMLMERIKDFNLSASRIFNIISGKDFPKEKFGSKHLDKVEGNFEFKNVTFNYVDNEPVLDNMSFKVKANETVAFVGKTGVGKTTIFNLLCKMYDIEKGEITIDGVNIKELDKESIRGNITIISQNPYIFNLSIRDNLRLVKENLTEEEMIEACKMACLHDFIEVLPDKYDTIVGEGGISLSGGQRQRLAIARAFVQKTEIILFDEATSALDNKTQAEIQKAIENLQKEYTILIIAHRLSTVKTCDRILFLDKGKIIDEGTHQELLKKNKEYRNLYEAEINK